MKIFALTLFHRRHSNHKPSKSVTIAAWHWKWSLTWSWLITWNPVYIKHGKPWYFIRYNGYKSRGLYFACGLKIPVLGHFAFENQPTMSK